MKFSIKETADLVTFTEKILNEKLHFLCSVRSRDHQSACVRKMFRQTNIYYLQGVENNSFFENFSYALSGSSVFR